MMKKLSDFFSVASGTFAIIPGITILISNVGVPPNSSKTLFAGVIEALGVLTLMLLWVNREWVKQINISTINKLSIFAISLFIVSLFSYIFLYNYLVVDVENSQSLFFPLWPSGELKTSLIKLGSRSELINQWGRDDVYKVIQSSSQVSLLITTLLMLLIYQLTFVTLTFAFGILGIKSSTEEAV